MEIFEVVFKIAGKMSLIYIALAMATAICCELIAISVNLRQRALRKFISEMLDDVPFDGIAKQLYETSPINPFGRSNKLTFIDPILFAEGFLQHIHFTGSEREHLAAELKSPRLRSFIVWMLDATGGDIEKVKQELINWFAKSMNLASAIYRQQSIIRCFFISLTLSVMVNIDSFRAFKVIRVQAMLPTLKGVSDDQMHKAMLQSTIGWDEALFDFADFNIVLGWLLSAAVATFIAPIVFKVFRDRS